MTRRARYSSQPRNPERAAKIPKLAPHIEIESGANVWPHEIKTAQALVATGKSVRFVRKDERDFTSSPDVLIDDFLWELKAPNGANIKAVERNVRKAVHQSPYIVFDSRRMKQVPDAAIERELHSCCNGRVKGIERLIFITRHADVLDIK